MGGKHIGIVSCHDQCFEITELPDKKEMYFFFKLINLFLATIANMVHVISCIDKWQLVAVVIKPIHLLSKC